MFTKLANNLHLLNNHALREINESEKTYVSALAGPSKAQANASRSLLTWGAKEGPDLEEFAKQIEQLTEQVAELYTNYGVAHDEFRSHYKSIVRREESFEPIMKRGETAKSKLEEATKKGKPVDHLKLEVDAVEKEIAIYESELDAFKRQTLQTAFHSRFDALIELGSKIAVVGTFGKFLADQIPQGAVPPGQEKPPFDGTAMKHIIADMGTSLTAWRPSVAPVAAIKTPNADSDASSIQTGSGAISPVLSPTSPTSTRATSPTNFQNGTGESTPLSRHDSVIITTSTPPGHAVPGSAIVDPYKKPLDMDEHLKQLKTTSVAAEDSSPFAGPPAHIDTAPAPAATKEAPKLEKKHSEEKIALPA